jgi:GTP-binding protein Era
MSAAPFRSGFVCVAGRPNVGKSTLVNRLAGQSVTITSPKPQTTRTRVLGVTRGGGDASGGPWQAVLVDTPGIHQARDPLNVRLVKYALSALADADLVLMMVEPLRTGPGHPDAVPREDDLGVLEHVRRAKAPVFLLVNKVDSASEAQVLETLRVYGSLDHPSRGAAGAKRSGAVGPFAEVVPISALTGRNVERLKSLIATRLPEGPPYFEPGQVTDQPQALLLGELVRQEAFRKLEQELPYSIAVRVEHVEAKKNLHVVTARILVERESQKGIVIGKGGRMLKQIGQHARRRMEGLLGTRVFLELDVAVLADWSRDPRRLTELGYPEE